MGKKRTLGPNGDFWWVYAVGTLIFVTFWGHWFLPVVIVLGLGIGAFTVFTALFKKSEPRSSEGLEVVEDGQGLNSSPEFPERNSLSKNGYDESTVGQIRITKRSLYAMHKKPDPDFDTWMSFYMKNEEWLLHAIFFREDRLPFDKDAVLSLILNEADTAMKSGLFETFEDTFLLHVGLVLKFRHPEEDFPLRARRLQIHAALIDSKSNEQAREYLKRIGPEWLEKGAVERQLIAGFLEDGKRICAKGRLSFDKFKVVNGSILV